MLAGQRVKVCVPRAHSIQQYRYKIGRDRRHGGSRLAADVLQSVMHISAAVGPGMGGAGCIVQRRRSSSRVDGGVLTT